MTQLTIYKASAGSGKTFQLVTEYLQLLIEDPLNYRHILAVTFTNKATAEMKERIVAELYKISIDGKTGMSEKIQSETGYSFEKIQQNAQQALSFLLHDYGRFTVSTIDSFFQKVLRSFARETGLYGAYAVELDQDLVIEEASSRLLMSVEENKELLNWLLQMAEDQLERGENWQVNSRILEFGNEVFKESFYPYLQLMNNEEDLRLKIRELRKTLKITQQNFERKTAEIGNSALQLVLDQGLDVDDFSYKKTGFMGQFIKMATCSKDFYVLGQRFLNALDNPDSICSAKSDKKAQIMSCYHGGLRALMEKTQSHLNSNLREYRTSQVVDRKLFVMGIMVGLVEKIRELGKETNTLLLSESVQILRKIIGANDAPFVYEKVGNYYKYFMIDEFQDTSVTQWDNFKPLIVNSLSEGNSNLVVGDVKQSIYRWRNSDWQLLNSHIVNDLRQFNVESVTLDCNWRSSQNVVDFNNKMFDVFPKIVQNQLNDILGDHLSAYPEMNAFTQIIEQVYDDAAQVSKSGIEGGIVEACLIEAANAEEYDSAMLGELIRTIEAIQQQGAKASDIAILIRQNNEADKIVSAFIDYRNKHPQSPYNFDIISDDALLVGNAVSVKFLVTLIRYLVTPTDDVLKATLVYQYAHKILPLLSSLDFVPNCIDGRGQQTDETVLKLEFSALFDTQIRDRYFPFFNQKGIEAIPTEWAALPVNELIGRLISVYALDRIDGEHANIQAFKDLVFDFGKRDSLTLHRLLAWWDEKGSRAKLQSSGDRDAIKLMTIHKSKGLEFPYVIIPNCHWGLGIKATNPSTIWCRTDHTPFDHLPVVPVALKAELIETYFAGDYLNELMLTYIDNLNMLYVAFTRAVDGLFVFSHTKKSASDKKSSKPEFNSVNDLLSAFVAQHFDTIPKVETEASNLSIVKYRKGELVRRDRKRKTMHEVALYSGKSVLGEYRKRLKVRVNYDDFLNGSAPSFRDKINHGKTIHDILAHIETTRDLDTALKLAVDSGALEALKSDEVRARIQDMFGHPLAANWFDGSMRIVNETALLEPAFALHRPDRVMLGTTETIVIEYKSGDRNPSHQRQLSRYMRLMEQVQEMPVRGFVWYINENELIEVE